MDREQRWAARARARAGRHRRRGGGILTGMTLIVIGALFLLHNLHVFDFEFNWHAWPLFLVVFGVVRLIDRSDRSAGLWLVGIGLWLYVNENGIWDLDYENSWPFLLVFGGLMMVWRALRENAAVSMDEPPERDEPPRDGGTP